MSNFIFLLALIGVAFGFAAILADVICRNIDLGDDPVVTRGDRWV